MKLNQVQISDYHCPASKEECAHLNLKCFTSQHFAISQWRRGLSHHQSPGDIWRVTFSLDPPRDLHLEVGALTHRHVYGLRLLQLWEQNVQSRLVLSAQPVNQQQNMLIHNKTCFNRPILQQFLQIRTYSGDLNSNHLNYWIPQAFEYRDFCSSDFKWFGI